MMIGYLKLCRAFGFFCVLGFSLSVSNGIIWAQERIVARVCGPRVVSLRVQDGHRLQGNNLIQAKVSLGCGLSQTVEFASPCGCNVGEVIESKKGKTTIGFKNGDHVHLRAIKNKKTGEVKVKVDHDD